MEVLNKIAEAKSSWRKNDVRDIHTLEYIVIHRIGPTVGLDAAQIAEFFIHEEPNWTGGRMPYHFVIDSEGVIEQAVPLKYKAPGAKRLNSSGIQVACVGDFREHNATKAQYKSLVSLCTFLCDCFPKLRIVGHTSVKGASSDPNKDCPGDKLSVANLRLDVRDRQQYRQRLQLLRKGIS